MSRYVPPHLRDAGPKLDDVQDSSHKLDNVQVSGFTLDDIHNHFWSVVDDDDNDTNYSAYDRHHGKTLHDAAESPGTLAYLIIYWGANPRWDSEHIIFTKSCLDLLPEQVADQHGTEGAVDSDILDSANENTKPPQPMERSSGPSIAVFKQATASKRTTRYEFEGWFKIEHVAFLEPESDDLVRMLEQKFTKMDRRGNSFVSQRTGDNWQRSLRLRWAVVKLVKDNTTMKERGPPDIVRQSLQVGEGSPSGTKSVNEMLEEMRLKDTDAKMKSAEASSPS